MSKETILHWIIIKFANVALLLSASAYLGGALSVFTFLIFLIIAFLLPIWLMFSSYSNCPQERLGAYYVTDLELCKTIDPRNWKIEKINQG